ncbi:hypothetical protein C0989_001225 [Termitomyces sp. Mn162]|nr:hypothetical protein C0989_001225 [Termitomyces sp. Mn162]
MPRHWTPDPNQAFYAPSISQGIPPGWRRPPAFHADGNNPRINPGGYSAAPPNPAYLPPTHYYAYPIPAAAPVPPEAMDNYSPPPTHHSLLKPLLPLGSKGSKPTPSNTMKSSASSTCYPDASTTLEVWADQLLNFHEHYLQGNLPENTQGTLGIDDNLRNKLRALVEEIHTSPNPRPFEDPLDPACSFHVQCEEPIGTQNKAPSSVPHQQEELNAASSILRNLNPAGGLFDQPTAHTLALSTRPRASSDDTRDALAREGKLDIQKPKPFTGCDPRKWRIFLTQCLTIFQAKPITFQLESSRVAFAASYLQGIAFDHYTALLWFNPNNPVLSNWLAFTQEFSSKFGVFDTVAEVEENLFNLRMRNNKRFTTFIVRFKQEAYKTGWNYNALWFALRHALPQRIKDVLHLVPKQTTYDGYKALITQVDQRYWEDCSENTAPRTSWNTSGNTNWQAGATNGI